MDGGDAHLPRGEEVPLKALHIFDFEGDLYGETVKVTFLRRLRDERRFGSVDELIQQLIRDREESLRVLTEHIQVQ